IDRLLRPRSVAVVGASDRHGALGATLLNNLVQYAFDGEIYPVNPKRDELQGHKVCHSVDELPEGIDCAVLAIPRPFVLDTVRSLAERKCGAVVIYSAGFSEAGEEGLQDQLELGRIAEEGVEGRWGRHRAMAQACAEWVTAAGDRLGVEMSVLADAAHRSPTVTCVRVPGGTTGPAVVKAVKERGFVIGGGYGKLKQDTIRIGHMGDHTVAETEAVLEATEDALRALMGGGR
ncbi:MAG: CoA-binding protein, partial [Gemmatimonadetes bacterium]|nr:CoA-binding protein [Gemmatimonadota bacterium]